MRTLYQTPAHNAERTNLRKAWWSLALYPLSLALGMVVGEAVPALFGYENPTLESTPLWIVTTALVLAVAIFALPLVLTARWSRRAVAAGWPSGRHPLWLALGAVGGFVGINLASGLLQLVA